MAAAEKLRTAKVSEIQWQIFRSTPKSPDEASGVTRLDPSELGDPRRGLSPLTLEQYERSYPLNRRMRPYNRYWK